MKTDLNRILIIFFLCSLVSHTQEASDEKEILPAKLSIIAIGPKPPRRFSASGGGSNSASALLPPRAGEVPPRRLYFDVKDEKEVDEVKMEDQNGSPKPRSINVTFNNPSHFIEVPANKTLKLQRRVSQDGNIEYSDYISIDSLEPGSMTVILLRPMGKGDKRWVVAPKQHRIDLLSDKLKDKKLVLLNLSRRSVKSIFHQDQQMLQAGGFQVYESIEGLDLHRIVAAYGREDKVIYNTALRLNKSNRLLFYILYDANPNTNDGRTVGLFRTSVDPEEATKTSTEEK